MQLRSYPKHAVPREIAVQIRSYIRMQWPFLNGRGNRIWDFAPREGEPTTFVLVDDEILISHAEVNYRPVMVAGETLKVGGLSAVFTYPAFRGSGSAEQVVVAATEALNRSDADVAMLFCGERVESLYFRCGWTPVRSAQITYGDRAAPKLKDDNIVMMLFISERGKKLRSFLEKEKVYVGENTW